MEICYNGPAILESLIIIYLGYDHYAYHYLNW